MAEVRVFFATNRNYQPSNKREVFGKGFNADGVAALRFGYADFEAEEAAKPVLKSVFVYPDVRSQDIMKTGGGKFLDALRKEMSKEPRNDTLTFIHGFNVSFTGAITAGAYLARDLKAEGQPVNVLVFTWPSDGEKVPWMSYYSDREDARGTGGALARAFLKFAEYVDALNAADYCQRRVHLLTHSMGAYLLRQGLQALRSKDNSKLIRLFDQIVLAAPDEDDDAFECDEKLRLLPRLGRQVTVYFNTRDKALLISDRTKANPDRLGSDGPRLVDLLPKKVVLVDASAVAGSADRFIEHSYYIRSEAMTEDISLVLEDRPPEAFANRDYDPRSRAWRIKAEIGTRPIDEAVINRPPPNPPRTGRR